MTVLTVRPGQSISAAVNAAPAGATVDVYAGIYTNDFVTISRDVTLQAVNSAGKPVDQPVVHMTETPTQSPPNDKGMILVGTPGLIPGDAPNVTITGFEISNVAIPGRLGGNGAAVRWQAGNLTLNDVYFHNNQEGLLGTPAVFGTGVLNIQSSEFAYNGTNGSTHGLYVGYAASVTINDSYFHDTVAGHEIKSRAAHNTITNDRIFGNGSTDSNQIDLPNGGVDIVSNDMIQKGLGSENPRFIGFGEGPTLGVGKEWAGSSLTVSNTDFINNYGSKAVAIWDPANLPVVTMDDGFWGMPAMAGTGDIELKAPPPMDFNHPWMS